MDKRGLNNLLVKVSDGDEVAFEKLYMETSKGIYALIYPYFHNREDTEDALQEIYMRIKDKVHLYKKGTDARSWIFQLAKNHALNKLRDKTRNTDFISEDDQTKISSDYQNKSLDKTMFILMQKVLTEEEYEIVIRYILMGYKHREIAIELNIPLGTVLYKYQNALQKIRKELE